MHSGYFDHFQHADIDEIADVIGELLQNPITIEDADHKLIAYSSHGDSTDPARWSTIMGRRVPEKVLTRLWKDGVFQQLLTQSEPVHIPAKDEVGLGKRVAIAIRKGKDVLGYIWAQEVNRPFQPEDDDILKEAAKAAVSRLVHRQGKRKAEEQRRKEFFWELLLGNHTSEAVIKRKADALQLNIPSPFLVCIIEANSTQLEQYLFPLLIRDKLLWVMDGQQLILLMGTRSVAKEGASIFHDADHFLQESTGRVGERMDGQTSGVYGRSYTSFVEVKRSYQEALQVLQVKRLFPEETRKVKGYHDLGIYRFLPQLKKWEDAEQYENERLVRLRRYDQEHQSNLIETLETYLDAAGKVNVTAQRLHIHINTLSYRLRRVEEIMGVDLEDMNQRTTLYLDLKLEKLSKETQN